MQDQTFFIKQQRALKSGRYGPMKIGCRENFESTYAFVLANGGVDVTDMPAVERSKVDPKLAIATVRSRTGVRSAIYCSSSMAEAWVGTIKPQPGRFAHVTVGVLEGKSDYWK